MRKAILMAVLIPTLAGAGAPTDGTRFMNLSGRRDRPGLAAMAPFFLRKAWTTLVGRAGAAPVVPYDLSAIAHNPSITWIGHSTMLVRMDGATFLTDPMFSERASPLSFAGPKRLVPPGIPLEALPPVDFVLISHDHYDHCDEPSIRALAARGARFVVPRGLGAIVARNGGTATELDWWDTADVAGVRVHCTPAQHFAGRGVTDENERLWGSWVVEGPTRRFFHSGDTGYFDGFAEIGRRLGPIDLASIAIGAYDPAEIMQFVHINPEESLQAARDLRAARVLGMHWGTFDLTDEPLDEPPRRFHAAAPAAGYDEGHAITLAVGETRRW